MTDESKEIASQQAVVVQEGPSNLLSAIVAMAQNPNIDVAKLQALLEMQSKMEARQAEADFNRAFHEMEPRLPRIKKNGEVSYKGQPAFKFSRWEDVDASIRPILREHGFSLSFNTSPRVGDGGGLIVTGTLLHTSGHSRSASIPLALDGSGGKNNIQGAGSTFSYGARYTTRMLLNIISEGDDDSGIRGGMKFITDEECAEIRRLMKEAGRNEADWIEKVTRGEVRSVEEIESPQYVIIVNMLAQIIQQQKAKKGKPE